MARVVEKVVSYITRQRGDQRELLVFTHHDVPEAGVQVPAGTVEPGEEIEHALFREIREETGLTDITLVRKLAVYDFYFAPLDETHRRHVFHLLAPTATPDTWQGAEGQPGQEKYWIFDFYWTPLDLSIDLAGHQGDLLGEI